MVVGTSLGAALIRAGRPRNAEYLINQNLRELEQRSAPDLLAANERLLGRAYVISGENCHAAERLLWEALEIAVSPGAGALQALLCLVDLVRLHLTVNAFRRGRRKCRARAR